LRFILLDVQNLLNAKGPNSYESLKIERVLFIRKVAPLTKALKEFSLITGLRAENQKTEMI
jgi:3'-phosphoadenosine 5'-phosphosulfate sulfotransferase (PAPS reductase)/FAD synthetase